MEPIKRLRSVHLATPELEASTAFYTAGFGLRARGERDGVRAFSGARSEDAVLRLEAADRPRMVGLTFALADAAALARAREALGAAGLEAGAGDPDDASGVSFSVTDPDGRRIAFAVDAGAPDEAPVEDGRPLFVSHAVLNSPDAPRLSAFYTATLGLGLADRYEKGLLDFLRVDQPQHHCLGVSPAERASLNHFSVDVGSIDALMRGIGRMKQAGHEPIWGPGRHGPGGNVFCYFEDPAGFVAELTCEVGKIADDAAWEAKEWPRVPEVANVWLTGGPTPRAIALMGGEAQ